jgi:hypothetical protein
MTQETAGVNASVTPRLIGECAGAFRLPCGGHVETEHLSQQIGMRRGTGPFLVTANHVYQGFLDAKNERPDAVCIVSDVRFDLAARHIASDPAYDIATFRVAHDEISKLANIANGKIILTGSQASWPPPPPAIDRGVANREASAVMFAFEIIAGR